MLKLPVFATLIALAALSGCATSHVMVGQARPPISPDQVQIYLHPPAGKYLEIALLDTSSRSSFAITAQGKTNVVMNRLKAEAAKLGANGILLEGVGDQAGGSVGTEQHPGIQPSDLAAQRPCSTRRVTAWQSTSSPIMRLRGSFA
jgi:hypothetical protein